MLQLYYTYVQNKDVILAKLVFPVCICVVYT